MESIYITFTLSGALYALEAHLVREIIWLPELTRLTNLPDHMAGVVHHRGRVVPVMDLNRRFNSPARSYQISDQVIIMEQEDIVVGLIANEVLDACAISTEQIQAIHASEIGVDPRKAFITHVAKQQNDIVMLLDIRALIHDPPSVIEEVEEVGEVGEFSDHRLPSGQESQDDISFETGHDYYFCPSFNTAERALLRERAINIGQPVEHQDVSGHISLAVVRLNQEYFGVDLRNVQEFAEVRDIVPMPCCPEFIIGNMNLRGDVLTLVDIRAILKLGVGDEGIPHKVIVTRVENLLVGVLVNDVADSIHVSSKDIMGIPSTVKGQGTNEGYLKGTAPYYENVLSLLDLPKLLMSGAFIVDEQIS